ARRPDPAEWAPFVLFGAPAAVAPGERLVFPSSPAVAPSPYRLEPRPPATTLRFGQQLRLVARAASGQAPASVALGELHLLYVEAGAGRVTLLDSVHLPPGAPPAEIAFPRPVAIAPPAGLERFVLLAAPAPVGPERLEK